MEQSQVLLLLGFVGLAILAVDVYLRKKQQSREAKWREEQQIREIEWRKERNDAEKERFKEWIGNTDKLATIIKNKLIDSSLLYSHKTKIDSEYESIFNDRKMHYADEKKFIANKFVPLLMDRCEYLLEKNKKNVCLLVDSGTTMCEFLKRFSEEASMRANIEEEEKKEKMSISVATNNIPGAMVAMEKGRLSSIDRFSKMSFTCHLFQGELLVTYSAVTGDETNAAVIEFIEKRREDTIFIGITVGNWVRIRSSEPRVAIPMARGTGHLSFKQTLINYSDEIFVISPLAKIFTKGEKDINKALKLDDTKPWKKPYKEIDTKKKIIIGERRNVTKIDISKDEEKVLLSKIKLVTTDRMMGMILHEHAFRLKDTFDKKILSSENIDKIINTDNIEDIESLIMFDFNNLPENEVIQTETEFPHIVTQDPNFLKIFFNISRKVQK